MSKARQAKTEMKILQPILGILVALTKNEVMTICNEPGIMWIQKRFYPILHELKNAYNQRYITSYFLWFGPQISTIPYRGVQYVTIVYFVCTLCTVKVFIYKSRGEIFLENEILLGL